MGTSESSFMTWARKSRSWVPASASTSGRMALRHSRITPMYGRLDTRHSENGMYTVLLRSGGPRGSSAGRGCVHSYANQNGRASSARTKLMHVM